MSTNDTGSAGDASTTGDSASSGTGDGSSTDSSAGMALVVTPSTQLKQGLFGQDVRLTIIAASTKGAVLVVPLAAVTARADDRAQVVWATAQGVEQVVTVRAGTSGEAMLTSCRSPARSPPATIWWWAGEGGAGHRFTGVGLTHPGPPEVAALRHCDLAVSRAEYVAVVGPSGSGKST